MFTQYKLPYAYDALEPNIDALTMETHYSKHHAAYTKNLNAAVEAAGVTDTDIVKLLSHLDALPKEQQIAIRNNGGGFYNHNLYFSILIPQGRKPSHKFEQVINDRFGSLNLLIEELSANALGQFGSGWAWLSVNPQGDLKVSKSPNQDNPLMENNGYVPILGIDVWEHAYYLKYKNVRGDYVKSFFQVLNWEAVEENYKKVVE